MLPAPAVSVTVWAPLYVPPLMDGMVANTPALHCAVAPPLLPVHDHDHGPVPTATDAVPALHRLDVGLDTKTWPPDDPHAPGKAARVPS